MPKSQEIAVKIAQQTRRQALAQALYDASRSAGRAGGSSMAAVPTMRRTAPPPPQTSYAHDDDADVGVVRKPMAGAGTGARPSAKPAATTPSAPPASAAHTPSTGGGAGLMAASAGSGASTATPGVASKPLFGAAKAAGGSLKTPPPATPVTAQPPSSPTREASVGTCRCVYILACPLWGNGFQRSGYSQTFRGLLRHVNAAGMVVSFVSLPAPKNPFAKSVMASPSKRGRDSSVLDKLVGASPPQKKLLSRSSTFAEEGMQPRSRVPAKLFLALSFPSTPQFAVACIAAARNKRKSDLNEFRG